MTQKLTAFCEGVLGCLPFFSGARKSPDQQHEIRAIRRVARIPPVLIINLAQLSKVLHLLLKINLRNANDWTSDMTTQATQAEPQTVLKRAARLNPGRLCSRCGMANNHRKKLRKHPLDPFGMFKPCMLTRPGDPHRPSEINI